MAELNKTDIGLGDEIQVRTFLGRDGNVVGRLPDGRIILFGKDSPYLDVLRENQLVDCHVIFVHENYIIVEPMRAPSPIPVSEQSNADAIQEEPTLEEFHEDPALMEELQEVSENVYGDMAILAKALLHVIRLQQHLIRRLEDLTQSR